MDTIQQKVVQTLFSFLVDNVDPRYIMAELFRRRGMSRQLMQKINSDNCSHHRSLTFFLEIVDTCPFHVLVNCLRYTQHTFVAVRLVDTYQRMKKEDNTSMPVQSAMNQCLDISDEKYVYEELRLYRDNGAIDTLERRVSSIVWKWNTDYKTRAQSVEKARVARVVMDAKLAWLRFLLEADKPCDVLQQIHDVGSLIVHTEHPLTSTIMVMAAQAQMLMFPKGYDMEDIVHKYNSIRLVATSLRLDAMHLVNFYVAEFCIDCISYERTGKQEIKDRMKTLLERMINTVDNLPDVNKVDEQYRSAFIRRCLLVKVLLYLGMTHRGKPVTGSVSGNDLTYASMVLQQVFKDWGKLEIKWQMLFYVAKARLRLQEGRNEDALKQAELAQQLSNELHHSEERRNISELVQNVRRTLIAGSE
ncbi:uncharacterized protein [Argopecten irradians]|uniref:uncharacterized protein n=1 Tax=Argopecten irradians TaxID=31199 RepID=UPI0037162E1C